MNAPSRLFRHCSRAIAALPGVQPWFNVSNYRANTVYLPFLRKMHARMYALAHQKRHATQGRMCEVS